MNASLARGCRVYVFVVWNPHDGYATKTVGYVGETGRLPFERLLEHVYSQPWADTIVSWYVLDEVYPDKRAVLAAEDATIKKLLPLYNYEGNLDNPRRIPIPEAKRQRAARDLAKGAVPRAALTDTTRPLRETAKARRPRPVRRSRRYPRPARRLGVAGASWALLALLAWVGAWRAGLPLWLGLRASALLAAALVLACWWLFPKRDWDTRVAGMVAICAAVLTLWTVAPVLPRHLLDPRPAHQETRNK